MNISRYLIAVVVSFVVMGVVAFGGMTLGATQMSSLMAIARGPEDLAAMTGWGMAGYLIITAIFTYIYIKGREAGDAIEGAKFGLMFGVLMSGAGMVGYSMLPYEMTALVADTVINLIVYTLGGITVALIYKPITE